MIVAQSLKEARELGLQFYRRATPCKHGNVAPRCIKTNKCKCVMCTGEVKANDRKKYWRSREAKLEYQKRRFEENRRAILDRNREYRQSNADALRAKDRLWYAANREQDIRRRSDHYAANKGSTNVRIAAWYLKNRAEIIRKNVNLIRQRGLRVPCWFGELDELVVYEASELCELRSVATGTNWEVDHMLPMRGDKVSGLHSWNNIQVIPRTMNRSKSKRMWLTNPGEWIAHLKV